MDSFLVNASMARLYWSLEKLDRKLMRGEVSTNEALEMLRRMAFDPDYELAWSKIERDVESRTGRVGVRL
ncbi:MAG: hypothetical protein JHC26_11890 [Thermofilum sp.]|jgi:hypothetical protein|uniref:hypothetical protein n=1 Tax=Thermofilum sp. TaxID=1961369 RepID=UPI0025848EA4|nr:hypothetical protein [Thermofilum sp.]MCI4409785.1 hypothetical protein [Thermofilum sp.]